MATETLIHAVPTFGVGTSVGAYPYLGRGVEDAAPTAAAVETAAVAADGTITFTALDPGVRYVAAAKVGGVWKKQEFWAPGGDDDVLEPELPFLSVKDTDFGAVGDDVTDDTAAIKAAVLRAYVAGWTLAFPDGEYYTTASIPYLHQVRKVGPGRIRRGADYFAVEPNDDDTNILYASGTLGSSANDGLSSLFPMDLQTACDRLSNYGPMLNGTWRIQGDATTFTASGTIGFSTVSGLLSTNRVEIRGPDVDWPDQPTMKINAAGKQFGLRGHTSNFFHLEDIEVLNADVSQADVGSAFICGINANGLFKNLWSNGNGAYAGINISEGGRGYMQSGKIYGSHNYPFRGYASSVTTLGYNDSGNFVGDIANGSQVITDVERAASGSGANVFPLGIRTGLTITHANFPAGTTITSFDKAARTITVSNPATATATDATITVANGPWLTGATAGGVLLQGHAYSDIFNTLIESCGKGIVHKVSSRSRIAGNEIRNNNVAVVGTDNSIINLYGSPNVLSGNLRELDLFSGAVEESTHGDVSTDEQAVFRDVTGYTLSGTFVADITNGSNTLTDVELTAGSDAWPLGLDTGQVLTHANIPVGTTITALDPAARTITLSANATGTSADASITRAIGAAQLIKTMFVVKTWMVGKKLRIRATGRFAGAGTKSPRLYFGPGDAVFTAFTSGAGSTNDWELEVEYWITGAAAQTYSGHGSESGGAEVDDNGTTALTVDGSRSLRIYGLLSDPAGQILVDTLEVWLS